MFSLREEWIQFASNECIKIYKIVFCFDLTHVWNSVHVTAIWPNIPFLEQIFEFIRYNILASFLLAGIFVLWRKSKLFKSLSSRGKTRKISNINTFVCSLTHFHPQKLKISQYDRRHGQLLFILTVKSAAKDTRKWEHF